MYVATASPRPKRSAFDSSRGGNVPCVPPPWIRHCGTYVDKSYRRTSFNCVVQLLCLCLFSYIANLIITSAQIARRGGLLIE